MFVIVIIILLIAYKQADTGDVATYEINNGCKVKEAIDRLEKDFILQAAKIRSSFKSISVSHVKELLKELPAGEVKGQVGCLFNKGDNFSMAMRSDDVDQLFAHLSNIQAWDFLHPQLLEYLVQELGDDKAKRNMEEYKSHLVYFRKTTKMSELSGWFGNISETSKFQKIVLSLGDNWKEKTYEEFEVLRISLLRQQVFFQSSLHLCGVLTGSLLVALAIPKSVDMVMLKQNLMQGEPLLKFLKANQIHGIYAEGLCLIHDVHDIALNPRSGELPQYSATDDQILQPTFKTAASVMGQDRGRYRGPRHRSLSRAYSADNELLEPAAGILLPQPLTVDLDAASFFHETMDVSSPEVEIDVKPPFQESNI